MDKIKSVIATRYLGQQHLFDYFWQHTTDNMFAVAQEPDGRFVIIDFNPVQMANLNIPVKSYYGVPLEQVFAPDIVKAVTDKYRRCLNSKKPYAYTEKAEYEGIVRYWNTQLVPILESEDNRPIVFGISREMTEIFDTQEQLAKLNAELENTVLHRTQELQKANDELKKLALTDNLTQIGNRGYFFEQAKAIFDTLSPSAPPVSLLYIDLDHFKQLNDTYGHSAGDEVLKELATRLKTSIRKTDILCRAGGEEFIILLPDSSVRIASEKAIELLDIIRSTPYFFGDIALPLTASIGIATLIPKQKTDLDTLVYRADQALYVAKNRGRNRVEVFVTQKN
jgi:diguanylate cyclase (GGDEF)-like protein